MPTILIAQPVTVLNEKMKGAKEDTIDAGNNWDGVAGNDGNFAGNGGIHPFKPLYWSAPG